MSHNPFRHRAAEQLGDVEIIECDSLLYAGDEAEYAYRLENMLLRKKLVMMTDIDRAIIKDGSWLRAGGGAICATCKEQYAQHPRLHQYAILTKLCDGRLVKL